MPTPLLLSLPFFGGEGIHVYVSVCTSVGECSAHGDQICFQVSSFALILTEPGAHCLAMLVGQWMPGSVGLCLPRAETTGVQYRTNVYVGSENLNSGSFSANTLHMESSPQT